MTFAEVRKEIVRQSIRLVQAGFLVEYVILSEKTFDDIKPVFDIYIYLFRFKPITDKKNMFIDGRRLILCNEEDILLVIPNIASYLKTKELHKND